MIHDQMHKWIVAIDGRIVSNGHWALDAAFLTVAAAEQLDRWPSYERMKRGLRGLWNEARRGAVPATASVADALYVSHQSAYNPRFVRWLSWATGTRSFGLGPLTRHNTRYGLGLGPDGGVRWVLMPTNGALDGSILLSEEAKG